MLSLLHKTLKLLIFTLLITACSDISPVPAGEGSKIIGTITYDRVPVDVDAMGSARLNYCWDTKNYRKVSTHKSLG